MINYTVEFVELKSGKKPFFEFLKKLRDDDVVKIFARIDFFISKKNSNEQISDKLSKYLKNGIFEIKCELSDKSIRVLYFYIDGAKMVITHGFIKKSNKTDPKEIEKAINLKNQYEEER
ncbi:MAG: type II toxin-antitoxin system RelE/ParE family toxin [Campylobacterales bacterium]|nr:type II toxin-antitoxin system RelE/ParE family toxin [Campylobacterales bacterium]